MRVLEDTEGLDGRPRLRARYNGGRTLRDSAGTLTVVDGAYPGLVVDPHLAVGTALGAPVYRDENTWGTADFRADVRGATDLVVVGNPATGRRNGLDAFTTSDYASASLTGGDKVSGVVKLTRTGDYGAGVFAAIFARQVVQSAVALLMRGNAPGIRVYDPVITGATLATVFPLNVVAYFAFSVDSSAGTAWGGHYDVSGALVEELSFTFAAGATIDRAYYIGREASGVPLDKTTLHWAAIADGSALPKATLAAIVAADVAGIPPRVSGLPEWVGLATGVYDPTDPTRLIWAEGSGADVTAEVMP